MSEVLLVTCVASVCAAALVYGYRLVYRWLTRDEEASDIISVNMLTFKFRK